MNIGHEKLAKWGLSHLDLRDKEAILDVGCGGGKNISNFLELAPQAKVYGADYSEASVKKSEAFNRKAIEEGRAKVIHASVEKLPFESENFDLVTAFETIYFWPDLRNNFREIYRILRNGGTFLVCNEVSTLEEAEKWIKYVDMLVFTGDQIAAIMKDSGFEDIQIHERSDGRGMCVMGTKNPNKNDGELLTKLNYCSLFLSF